METIYQRLAAHLNKLSMGYPGSHELLDLLQAMFTPEEAGAAMGISTDLLPLQVADAATIAKRAGMSLNKAEDLLASMASKRAIYSTPMPSGDMGFALHQVQRRHDEPGPENFVALHAQIQSERR